MKCNICERGCTIPEGNTGACGLYKNNGENIIELFPNKYLTVCPISIETMPVLHFYPRGKFLQISTTGCNFNCRGCFSTVIAKEMAPTSKALRELSPQQVVDEAVKNECIGIAFLLNDPLASLPTFLKVATLAQKNGLLVGCSTNAYFTETSLAQITRYLDFINVGVKGLSLRAYQNCGGGTVQPVLRNIKRLYQSGIHVEVSCILQNNNMEEVLELAKKLANISPEIPLQLMRFIPLEGADPALEPSIRSAENLYQSLRKHLNYVYLFNSPGTDYLNTFCPNCGEVIFKRDFYGPMGAKLLFSESDSARNNICPQCGWKIPIKALPAEINYREGDFQGGYPFTRALEMVEAILITIGVTDIKQVVQVWESMLGQNELQKLHQSIQNIGSYLEVIRYFGKLVQMEEKAAELVAYIEEKISLINISLLAVKKKPRVYYAMGKPLFCLMGKRFENQLVEAAGGISVNKEIECSGRPGSRISVEKLNALNPDVIFISAFLSSSVEDFYAECCKAGINVGAVKNKRIYSHPAPGWDFGSPRWILGLLYMANMLHPEVYHFDVWAEAARFYKQFYGSDFSLAEINRSFSKPSNKWEWRND
ncbi:radical SAM protein [Desulfoscipio gibsoniae]|uniref:Pyruvate-formate lyase-activating enzyme n=1 Tax=Desulfoscipio gibsoniae DSM 7213 TaxID=767817 RepID=R4KU08_9FIRM|nr:radical SAM protein [Desulfoscipio gibsoniae]AGL03091.1 pyruvate-formate lyase-activating enzyme [Desulfoscipio gibsoniae DSM 7213]